MSAMLQSFRMSRLYLQCYASRMPPSDEGGGAEGDGGRDFLFEYPDKAQFICCMCGVSYFYTFRMLS